MKKIGTVVIIGLILLMLIIGLAGCGNAKQTNGIYFAKSVKVTTIDERAGFVGFTDIYGDEWYWYCEPSEMPWSLGDYALLVMWNAGTDYIYDDEIVSITTELLPVHIVAK